MVTKERLLGKRYDGGQSPLNVDRSILLSVDPPPGTTEKDGLMAVTDELRWGEKVHIDYDKIIHGGFDLNTPASEWVKKLLVSWGMTDKKYQRMSQHERKKLCDRLVRTARKEKDKNQSEMIKTILKQPRDPLTPGGHIEHDGMMDIRDCKRGQLHGSFFNNNTYKNGDSDADRRARTALHVRLRSWNAGPLKLERTQGSSLHHLADYEHGNHSSLTSKQTRDWFDVCQIVVVENDWGVAVPEIDGEWRVPFEFICWEFRISGVRVLAFTEADLEPNQMWCCYGADGHWVCDDYRYELGLPALPRGIARSGVDAVELRRVAKMCYDTIRATCIMLDAQVARQEHVAAPPKLVERRVKEGRASLRDHYVVRLLHSDKRAHRVRSASRLAVDARAPQRGHWRKGTWVHYDDQDSGQVQYTNDGGFIVSKTWRRWHFAGDPKNIIHKSYKL